MDGLDLLGAITIGSITIPTAGANYTDAKTVAAVQKALVDKGYNLGSSGPNSDGVDGIFGSKTKRAIKKLQAAINWPVTGKIDEGVISALQVTPGVLPPGVTLAGRAAVQAQVVLDAATAAEHAAADDDPQTAAYDVQAAAQQVQDVVSAAAPPPPPEVRQKVAQAAAQAKAAMTPAQVKAAAQAVKAAAQDVHDAVKPSWMSSPAWDGGPERWKVGAAAAAGAAGVGALLAIGRK